MGNFSGFSDQRIYNEMTYISKFLAPSPTVAPGGGGHRQGGLHQSVMNHGTHASGQ